MRFERSPRPAPRLASSRAVGFGALALLLLGGCQDKKAIAEAERLSVELAAATAARDSLAGIVSSADADKDRALTELAEASRFAQQIDEELRQVRGLSSKVQPQTGDESGRTQVAAAREDILVRLKQMRQRLNARQADLSRTRDSLVALRGESSAAAQLVRDLQAQLAQRGKEIVAFEAEVRELREANVQLTYEKSALADTVRQVETQANRVFYVVGTKQQLLDRRIVTEEGGSRALLVVRLGETLVPARSLDESSFTMADKRETLTIALPRSDKDYRIVSRHDASLVEADRKDKNGSFRGEHIRITDPTTFWAASPFLIIVEK
jgi:hypothetical protein